MILSSQTTGGNAAWFEKRKACCAHPVGRANYPERSNLAELMVLDVPSIWGKRWTILLVISAVRMLMGSVRYVGSVGVEWRWGCDGNTAHSGSQEPKKFHVIFLHRNDTGANGLLQFTFI